MRVGLEFWKGFGRSELMAFGCTEFLQVEMWFCGV